MLVRTGNYGRGVECKVPEMRRKVEFNCTSTNPAAVINCNNHLHLTASFVWNPVHMVWFSSVSILVNNLLLQPTH